MQERELTLVGLTEDGTRLVLVTAAGEEFRLPVDARLRSALHGDPARLGQLETKMSSVLRPRDIQARIRAGESPESVAAAAQTTLDKIMGFATPVLAERAHVAERAQRASVRRRGGEGATRVLGDAVAERLRERNVDPESVAWDAWRREDGRWTLVADYRAGEGSRRAEFVYDAPGRYVLAEDDDARWLVGESPAGSGAAPRSGSGRRLAAVPAPGDEELPLGEDAIGLVHQPPGPVPDRAGAELAARGDGDWIATQASDRATRPTAAPDEAEPAAETQAEEGDAGASPPTRGRGRRGRGRASVPSWDEIMFGGGRRD